MAMASELPVESFLADVRLIVEKDLSSTFEDFRKDVLQIAKIKGAPSASHKEIQKGAHLLHKIIKKHSKKNIHKFELYALKNIFSSEDTASKREDQPTSLPSDSIPEELEALRFRYAELCAQNNFLRDEAVASEALLRDMTKTIFDLRVGAQALDAHDVKPLPHTIAALSQGHRDLAELNDRAQSLTGEIHRCTGDDAISENEYLNRNTFVDAQHQANGGYSVMNYENDEDEDDIDTIDAEDIRQLNDLLK